MAECRNNSSLLSLPGPGAMPCSLQNRANTSVLFSHHPVWELPGSCHLGQVEGGQPPPGAGIVLPRTLFGCICHPGRDRIGADSVAHEAAVFAYCYPATYPKWGGGGEP